MLYFVTTPIGNSKEITLLAIETLQKVDMIYAEDVRHSLPLLKKYNIAAPVYEYQKFNEKKKAQEIIEILKDGANIALISDAGVPLFSDPGMVLVNELIANDLDYTVVGCPNAILSGLVLSGLPVQPFTFAGFLPPKNKDKEVLLAGLKNLTSTLVFFIAVHDVDKDIAFLAQNLGNRKASLVREISKKFESVTRFVLGEEIEIIKKGEFVLVVEGKKEEDKEITDETILKNLQELVQAGLDKKEAITFLAKELGIKKSEVYRVSLGL